MDDPSAASNGPVPREIRRALQGRSLRTLEWEGTSSQGTALLLHGMPGVADDWRQLAPQLPSARVIAVDRPGYGGSGHRTASVPEQVTLYERLLADAEAGPRLLLGHSYGAIPAVLLASELAARGDEVHLVLIAPALREHPQARTAPRGTALLSRALGVRGVPGAARLTVLSLPARAVAARAAGIATYGPDVVTASAHRALRDRAFHPRAVASAAEEMLRLAPDEAMADEQLPALTMPTTVIHGRGDRVVSPRAGARTALAIPGAVHHEIDGGHMVIQTRAEEIAALLSS